MLSGLGKRYGLPHKDNYVPNLEEKLKKMKRDKRKVDYACIAARSKFDTAITKLAEVADQAAKH